MSKGNFIIVVYTSVLEYKLYSSMFLNVRNSSVWVFGLLDLQVTSLTGSNQLRLIKG